MTSIKNLDDYLDYTKGKVELDEGKVSSIEDWLKARKAREDTLKKTREAFTKWAKG